PEHSELNPKGNMLHPPGIMAENYGHGGTDEPSGRSDTCWGECGALTTAALVERHYPEVDVPADADPDCVGPSR
ncbi:MAG: hypothetical protein ACC655_06190, partial [Rhodothermia bacterium]